MVYVLRGMLGVWLICVQVVCDLWGVVYLFGKVVLFVLLFDVGEFMLCSTVCKVVCCWVMVNGFVCGLCWVGVFSVVVCYEDFVFDLVCELRWVVRL